MGRRRLESIRSRLLLGFLLMAVLPAVTVALGALGVSYYSWQQQAVERLASLALLRETQLQIEIADLQRELARLAEKPSAVPALRSRQAVAASPSSQALQRLGLQSVRFERVLSVDSDGRPLAAGQQDAGFAEGFPSFSATTLAGEPQVVVPRFSSAQGAGLLFVAVPYFDGGGRVTGALVGEARPDILSGILRERPGLKVFLVGASGALLTEEGISHAHRGTSSGIRAVLESQRSGSGVYIDHAGVPVVGVYRWLPRLQAGLIVEQDLAQIDRAVYATLAVGAAIALAAVLVAAGAAFWITRSITRPLLELVTTTTRIATGDLDQVVHVGPPTEVAALARSFNHMTAQLRDLIGALERRVADRTAALTAANAALEHQTLQLWTSARVSREIIAAPDLDTLLNRAVALISDTFGYYHVMVYLLDGSRQTLVPQASSTVGNWPALPLGAGSLNGEAALHACALRVNDTAADPRFLALPTLPLTRAELVIPLRSGDGLIGTLDIQSATAHAFSDDDELVMQNLGDQLALAVANARLDTANRELAVLEERHRLARDLHDSVTQSLYSLSLLAEGWRRARGARDNAAIDAQLNRVGMIAQHALREMRLLLSELRPPPLATDGLAMALRERLDTVEQRAGIETTLLLDDLARLSPAIETEFYWIAREALNNALKHADATRVTVQISRDDTHAVLVVRDNGKGLLPLAEKGGLGLRGMRERATQLGGELQIDSGPAGGTAIRAAVPLNGHARDEQLRGR